MQSGCYVPTKSKQTHFDKCLEAGNTVTVCYVIFTAALVIR